MRENGILWNLACENVTLVKHEVHERNRFVTWRRIIHWGPQHITFGKHLGSCNNVGVARMDNSRRLGVIFARLYVRVCDFVLFCVVFLEMPCSSCSGVLAFAWCQRAVLIGPQPPRYNEVHHCWKASIRVFLLMRFEIQFCCTTDAFLMAIWADLFTQRGSV